MSKIEQTLFFPPGILEHIQEEASRIDASLSQCVQQAWVLARSIIGELPSVGPEGWPPSAEREAVERKLRLLQERVRSHYPASEKRRHTVFIPFEMLTEIKQEAQRQDRSISWIVNAAWSLAEAELTRSVTMASSADAIAYVPASKLAASMT